MNKNNRYILLYDDGAINPVTRLVRVLNQPLAKD
jgi:hypothetical protein